MKLCWWRFLLLRHKVRFLFLFGIFLRHDLSVGISNIIKFLLLALIFLLIPPFKFFTLLFNPLFFFFVFKPLQSFSLLLLTLSLFHLSLQRILIILSLLILTAWCRVLRKTLRIISHHRWRLVVELLHRWRRHHLWHLLLQRLLGHHHLLLSLHWWRHLLLWGSHQERVITLSRRCHRLLWRINWWSTLSHLRSQRRMHLHHHLLLSFSLIRQSWRLLNSRSDTGTTLVLTKWIIIHHGFHFCLFTSNSICSFPLFIFFLLFNLLVPLI